MYDNDSYIVVSAVLQTALFVNERISVVLAVGPCPLAIGTRPNSRISVDLHAHMNNLFRIIFHIQNKQKPTVKVLFREQYCITNIFYMQRDIQTENTIFYFELLIS